MVFYLTFGAPGEMFWRTEVTSLHLCTAAYSSYTVPSKLYWTVEVEIQLLCTVSYVEASERF
jgi:hypothetical protein